MEERSKESNTNNSKNNRVNLLVPVSLIFCLMICMVFYTSRVIRNVAVTNIHEIGEDRISSVAAQLENYLDTTKSVLWVTADAVDHLVSNGASTEEILQFITEESESQEQNFDENYTGIYGYVSGEYLDGVGWIPPEDYEPTERDWYLTAIEAGGEPTIVSPYVDAQTNAVIISISRMLSNGTDVLSLDVLMNHIQETVSELKIKGKGFGFIVNQDGMVIAHPDETRKGTFLTDTEEQSNFFEKLLETENGNFETSSDGQKSTVFVHQILDQWYVVIVIGNGELYAEVWQQLLINVLICIVIFALITFFYLLGQKNEQNYSRRIEEMRAEEQRQTYEAKALKLEKEAADRANKAKSDFLADMSHEIRTPINAVLGMNEMILRECPSGAQISGAEKEAAEFKFQNIRAYASNIESAGRNLLSIINDILDFSKIESGKMELSYGAYQFSSVLNDVSNMIFFKAKEKDLTFIVDVDETLPDGLYGDEVRIRQVITNLLNNAVKYTKQGSISLTVRGEKAADQGEDEYVDLRISVKDTGIGIKQEDIDKLFTKFQRVDLNNNSTVEGTGLGLAITRSLLEMMGGNIRVESEYGVGSEFCILLPQKIVAKDPIGDFQSRFKENVQNSKAYEETFRAPEAHILIVDDTKMNLKVALGLLKNTEMQIDTANSGEEALGLAKANAYDVILMDQRMPKMDGSECLKQIRRQDGGANLDTPIICLTADAVVGAKERYLSEGFTDYLTKPVDSRALEQMLMKYLPSDKVQIRKKEEAIVGEKGEVKEPGKETGSEEDQYSPLREAGIDPSVGLEYCQKDDEFYTSLLLDYAEGAEPKISDFRKFFESRDWKNYSILVHALKSTSKMIGAVSLAETAARLEAAANDENGELIGRDHDHMMSQYEQAAAAIFSAYAAEEGKARKLKMSEKEKEECEIMEFLPEMGFVDIMVENK